jgi:hypothetical protein
MQTNLFDNITEQTEPVDYDGAQEFVVAQLNKERNTDYKIICQYVREFGEITPAFIANTWWGDVKFGKDSDRRCRELKAKGVLDRFEREDGYTTFFFPWESK